MRTIKVAAAIIHDGDKILAAQRGYGDLAGGWEFPGGKLEEDETGEMACVREIREELGVLVGNLSPLCTVEHDYETFHLSMECFLCTILEGMIDDIEHASLRWLDHTQLWEVNWLPADEKVVRELESRIGS